MGRWALVGRGAGPGARQIPHHRNLLYGDQLEYFLNSLQGVFSPLSPAVDRCQGLCSGRHSPGRHSGKQREPPQADGRHQQRQAAGERRPLCHTQFVQLSLQTQDWKGSSKRKSKSKETNVKKEVNSDEDFASQQVTGPCPSSWFTEKVFDSLRRYLVPRHRLSQVLPPLLVRALPVNEGRSR